MCSFLLGGRICWVVGEEGRLARLPHQIYPQARLPYNPGIKKHPPHILKSHKLQTMGP
jgi:hypothetical protein